MNMKLYPSMLMLYAGAIVPRFLVLLGLTAAAETALFSAALSPERNLEEVFAASHISLVMAAALLLLTLLLTLPRFDAAKLTIARLSLKPREVFLCHALSAACCYVVFWGFQVCLLMGLFHWYGVKADPMMFGPQTIVLTVYRMPLLHGLLPLAHWSIYLRNFSFVLAMGCAAAFPNTRPGQHTALLFPAVLAAALLFCFPAELSQQSSIFVLTAAALVLSAITVYSAERVHS